jgi:hypothetical protein
MNSFIQSLNINDKEDMPFINKKHIESFFVILNWGIYLMSMNKKKVLKLKYI